MEQIENLEKEIEEIKKRNKRVELDKAWETSIWRKIIIALITYILLGLYMIYLNVDRPWLNALIPTVGYMLSTLTLGWLKDFWIKRHQ